MAYSHHKKSNEPKRRFISYILDEPDRFLPYAVDKNPHMKDFSDLETAFKEAFPIQENNITSDELISFFETPQVQEIIRSNTTKEEYEMIKGNRQVRIEKPRGVVTIQIKEVKQKQSSGKTYSRKVNVSKAYFYTSVQNKFIVDRRKRGLTYKQITKEYNTSYPNNPRTESGIRTHSYRL